MALTIEQQESWQLALVSLFLLSLSTLLCQALLRAPDQEPGTQLSRDREFFTSLGFFVLFLLWIGAFLGWILCLGAVSGSSRNIALLYGVTAANGGGGLSVGKETRGVSYSAVLYFCYILADVFRHDARDFHGRRTSGGYLKDVGRLAERF